MNNHYYIFLHGNPGSAEDFDLMIQEMKLNREQILLPDFMKSSDPIKSITEAIQLLNAQQKIKVTVIAYSWGAYLAFKLLENTSFKQQAECTGLVLVSPFLKTETGLSSLTRMLFKTPVLNFILTNLLKSKLKAAFIRKSYGKKQSGVIPQHTEVLLSVTYTWLWAVKLKNWQEDNPLLAKVDLPILVVSSKDDEAMDRHLQLSIVDQLCGNATKVDFNDGAHALIHTETKKVVHEIEKWSRDQIQQHETPNFGYFPGEDERNNILSYLDAHAKNFPERIALKMVKSRTENEQGEFVFTYDEINYGDFASLVAGTAKNLSKHGLQKNDRVILFLPMCLELYTAMFALQRIGAIAVFLDSWARRDQLAVCAECVQPVAMISHPAAFELIKGLEEFNSIKYCITGLMNVEGMLSISQLMNTENGTSAITPVSSETTALVTFTTGSSGKPKGANRTHRFLSAQHLELKNVMPYYPSDIDLPAFPIFSLNNLASGVTTILPALDLANPSERDAEILYNQITNEHVTCCTLSPSMVVNVMKYCHSNELLLSNVRRVVTGGAPISEDDVRSFMAIAPNTEFWILYGSTEVEPMAHIEGREMLKNSRSKDDDFIAEGVNVGHISGSLQYKFIKVEKGIVDGEKDDLNAMELAPGEIGEFIVSGDHVCKDYYNNTEAFSRAKIRDKEGNVWHRTGDLGYLDQNGYLWIVGRIHNVVQRNGEFFFPVKPEILLKRFNFIDQCAFLGIPDTEKGEANAVVFAPNSRYKGEEDLNAVKEVFYQNNIPIDAYFAVDQIPLDPRHHSKVDYSMLLKQLEDSGALTSHI